MTSVDERHRARIVYPRPMSAWYSTPESAQAIVDFAGTDVDLVYAFRLFLAPLAEPWMSPSLRTQVVVDVDEDDTRTLRQIAALHRIEGNEGEAAAAEADAEKAAALAGAWIPQADLVLAAGQSELDSLAYRFPELHGSVLPNPSPETGTEGPAPPVDLLFVGNFSYRPNIDGAIWLCKEVLPLVKKRLDYGVRVSLVGSVVDPSVTELTSVPRVDVFADVPSVTPWYRSTRVCVAPLRAGGGTRLKILEAFTHRRPVVSTSLGAEGLSVEDGVHLLIADGTEDFADACARVLRDHALRSQLVDAAVDVAIAHSRPRVVRELAQTLALLADTEATRA
jgi:glycosyltransferase involved in cell wall biosynthesis